MTIVRDEHGTHYELLKQSSESSLVRDPSTGTERHLPNNDLETVTLSTLERSALAIPEPVRTFVRGVHDDRTLGLLLTIAEEGPCSVRTLLAETDYCESDLHGRLAVLTAVGLLEATTLSGEHAYQATTACRSAIEALQPTDA